MRESGKTASAFSESQYAVSEDKSPNVHTRQVKLQITVIVLHTLSSIVAAKFLNTCHIRGHVIVQEEGVRESAD